MNISRPGSFIYEEMEACGWSRATLAKAMETSEDFINKLIKGEEKITPDVAEKLANIFKTSPEFWLKLQKNYIEGM